jgi:hypothetical protein
MGTSNTHDYSPPQTSPRSGPQRAKLIVDIATGEVEDREPEGKKKTPLQLSGASTIGYLSRVEFEMQAGLA